MSSADAPRPRRGRPPSGGREAILAAAFEVLREYGASRLTTRQVANRAQVSEGSIFYHFTDRAGLLTAVMEQRLAELHRMHDRGALAGDGLDATLATFATAIESFLQTAMVVMVAAHSDVELRPALADYLQRNDLGPHRGVAGLAAYLEAEQRAGRVRPDADPEAAAMLLVSACFSRAAQQLLLGPGYGAELPGTDALAGELARYLACTSGNGLLAAARPASGE